MKKPLVPRKSETPLPEQRRYWLIAPGEGAKKWDQWTELNIAALGWGEIGTLHAFASQSEIQEQL